MALRVTGRRCRGFASGGRARDGRTHTTNESGVTSLMRDATSAGSHDAGDAVRECGHAMICRSVRCGEPSEHCTTHAAHAAEKERGKPIGRRRRGGGVPHRKRLCGFCEQIKMSFEKSRRVFRRRSHEEMRGDPVPCAVFVSIARRVYRHRACVLPHPLLGQKPGGEHETSSNLHTCW
jgi:hypothetical protein